MKAVDYFTNLLDHATVPDRIITLDFETFYDTADDYSLKKMSVEAYIRDPRFQTHGVGVKINDKPTHYFAGAANVANLMRKLPVHQALVVAQNTRFDGFIMSHVYGVQAHTWSDTMQLASMVFGNNLPSASLRALAKRLCPKHLQKGGVELEDVDGIRDLSPEQSAALGTYCKQDVDITYFLFQLFAKQLSDRPLELPILDLIIRMFTSPKLVLEPTVLSDLKLLEETEKAAALAAINALMETPVDMKAIRSNKQFAALLEAQGVEVPMKISITTDLPTYAFAKTDREFVDMKMHDNPVVQKLVAGRLRIKTSINETRAVSYLDVASRGTWPVALNVSGARTTHRLSGSSDGGGNPQNLGRKSPLREAIGPPPHHALMMADSSAIELRIAMTLAGEEDVVRLWKTDPLFDLYKTFAGYVFDMKTEDVQDDERAVGKVACLSLQYGSGDVTFRQTAWNRGIEMSQAEATDITNKFRAAFPHLRATWKQLGYVVRKLERGIVEETWFDHLAKANPTTIAGCPGFDIAAGLPVTYPALAWEHNARTGERELTYTIYPKRGDEDYAYGSGGKRVKIYGSKALQNICEGLGRNIVLAQTLAIDRWLKADVSEGSQSVMSIHDEGAWVIPLGAFQCMSDPTLPSLQYVLDGALDIMRTSPAWWPEIPLEAEGNIGVIKYSAGH